MQKGKVQGGSLTEMRFTHRSSLCAEECSVGPEVMLPFHVDD